MIEKTTTPDSNTPDFNQPDKSLNSRPFLKITCPPDGSIGNSPVPLHAFARDGQDGELSSKIRWSSNEDGFLDVGAWVKAELSPGRHVITAAVTDSDGRVGRDSITVIIGKTAEPTNWVCDDSSHGSEGDV